MAGLDPAIYAVPSRIKSDKHARRRLVNGRIKSGHNDFADAR
jgi:hypothetical protein